MPENGELREEAGSEVETAREAAGNAGTVTVEDAILLLAEALREDRGGLGENASHEHERWGISDGALEPLTSQMQLRAVKKLARELEVFFQRAAPENVPRAGELAEAHIGDPDQLNASLLLSYDSCLPLEPPARERVLVRARMMRGEVLLRELQEQQAAQEERRRQELEGLQAQQQRWAVESERRVSTLAEELGAEKRESEEAQSRLQEQVRELEAQMLLQQRQLGEQLLAQEREQHRLDDELRQHFRMQQSILEEEAAAAAAGEGLQLPSGNLPAVATVTERSIGAADVRKLGIVSLGIVTLVAGALGG